ncbi:MAG: hypothetical protein MRY64_07635 [Hyphomonadaceae bacterium]|nr:hypothetical protein [Hyphomonadaceae bacterium]
MRADTEPAILWALGFLARSLVAIAGRLGGVVFVRRDVFNRLRRELALLEAAARRVVLLIALVRMTALATARPAPAAARPGAQPPEKSAARTHSPGGFALVEPLADFPALDTAPWWQDLSPNTAPKPAAPLLKRLAALSALLEDPDRAARRFAGLIARMRARRLGRTHPFSLARPVWRGRGAGDLLAATASDLEARALSALDALGP